MAQPATAPLAEPAAAPQLNLEQRMLLRCSAALALLANRQESGAEWALAYPAVGERGREFFVGASARVADEAQLTDDQLASQLRSEAEELVQEDLLPDIMPVCLRLLDQSGL